MENAIAQALAPLGFRIAGTGAISARSYHDAAIATTPDHFSQVLSVFGNLRIHSDHYFVKAERTYAGSLRVTGCG